METTCQDGRGITQTIGGFLLIMSDYTVKLNGKSFDVRVLQHSGSNISFSIDGESYSVDVEALLEIKNPAKHSTALPLPAAAVNQKAGGRARSLDEITAPMPGIIVHLPVKEGDDVQIGQTVVVMEAMKMENNIQATKSGRIKKIHVAVGDEVENSRLLVSLQDV